MKILLSKILPIMLLAVLGCTDENTPTMQSNRNENPERYRFILKTSDLSTRVTYSGDKTMFEDDVDEIGVFSVINGTSSHVTNVVKTTNGIQELVACTTGQTIPTPKINSDYYIFYFPRTGLKDITQLSDFKSFSFTVSTDQSTLDDYTNSDVLWCYLNKSWSTETSKIQYVTMHHLMAKIVVQVSEAVTEGVKLWARTTAKNINFTTQISGKMNYSHADRAFTTMNYNGKSGDYNIYQAVIPAWESISAKSSNFKIILGTDEYRLSNAITFQDGYCYTFTIPAATAKSATRSDESAELLLDPPVVTKMEPEVIDLNTLK